MVCNCCGTQNNDSAKFCCECGQPLIEIADRGGKVGTPKRRTVTIAGIIAVVVVAFTVFFAVTQNSGSTESKLKGTWVRESTDAAITETVVYTFTSKGGTNTYNSENLKQPAGEAPFDWYVTEDNELILLWSNTSCIRYIWNPDFDSYNLSSNEYNWCVKGDKLYLSSTASPTGYYVYTK